MPTDEELIEEIHQGSQAAMEVLVRLYKSQGKFANWIITIAVNVGRDYFRSRQYRERQLKPLNNYMKHDMSDNLEELLAQKLERKQVQIALQELSESQREAILLRYYLEMKVCEIAEVTNSKESAVKSRLFQGISKLKRILQRRVDYEKTND